MFDLDTIRFREPPRELCPGVRGQQACVGGVRKAPWYEEIRLDNPGRIGPGKSGDIAAKRVEQCRCGRNSYRLTPLVGRKNNMIKLKGTTLYPPAINDVLDNVDYVADYVVYVQDSEAGTDDVVVKVALAHDPGCDVVKDLKDRFRARLRVAPNVEMLPKEEIMKVKFPAQSRKPVKFVDLRNKK